MPGYTPPAGNNVILNFTGAYAAPVGNNVTINFTNPLVLAVDSGLYALVGAAALLKVGRVLRAYDNLITNGAFSLDTTGWSVSGADTVFAAADGQGVLTLGLGASGGFAYQAIAVVPGKRYTLHAFLRPFSYSMTADSGVYNLSGADVTLTKSSPDAALSDQSISYSHSGAVGTGYRLATDGKAYGVDNLTGDHLLETWLLSGSAADFDVKATMISGPSPSGTFGSWTNLATQQLWSLIESSIGTLTCTFRVDISLAGAASAFDSATITLTATRTS